MPRVQMKDMKQYAKALGVLSRVGGTFQGVGRDEWFLLVTNAQYEALVEAKVVAPENGAQEQPRGKKAKRKAKL
jgi:hypothetical protein